MGEMLYLHVKKKKDRLPNSLNFKNTLFTYPKKKFSLTEWNFNEKWPFIEANAQADIISLKRAL